MPNLNRKQQPEPYGQTAVILFLLLLFLLAVLCIGIGLSWLETPPSAASPPASAAAACIGPQKKSGSLSFHLFRRIMRKEDQRSFAFFPLTDGTAMSCGLNMLRG